ncbi:hypothetical protein Acr_00g0036910 [Actinidia rufa]|uniref:Integrase catalytic domain-containing protein n=1 Tax=Actinidia rufa TaxID=165716 RepID=A0A7J0DGP7_9ERIC|nr:hypothetical protein Acr_00g0036910 [Actinidia rufa]
MPRQRYERRPNTISELVAHDLFKGCLSPNPLDRGKTSPSNLAKLSPLSSPEPLSEYSSPLSSPEPLSEYSSPLSSPEPLSEYSSVGPSRPSSIRGPVLRKPSNIDCWLHAPVFYHNSLARVCGNDSSRSSMHLRSRYLPRPSASSPPDNRAHPMANTSQVPDLEGLHHEIHDMAEQMRIMNENNGRLMQLLAAANPPLPVAPIPDIEQSRHSNHSGDHSQNISTERFKLPAQFGVYEGKTDPVDHLDSYKSLMSLQGCSDEVMYKAFSATLKGPSRSWFRKLLPGTIDSFGDLSRLFVANFMSCRNRQKNASHLFTIHQKETESLKDFVKRFNQAILEVEDPSDKVIIMAMMEALRLGPLFDSLSKNVPEILSALQSKADKYIAAEELAEAKRRRREKDDHKRKELDTRRIDYREETRYKRPDRDPKCSNDRRPRTPPRRPEGYLRKYVVTRPPPNSPERRYGDNRPTAGDIQMIHGGFGSGGCSTSSRKKHARTALRLAEEEIYNLSSSSFGDQTPITFSNDDLRGLHLSHDDALVVSAVIANFNVQRILIDNESSTDILFISAFERMKIGLDKLHPFHTPLIGFGGNTTHPLGWINLPITLETEPQQTTVWQDFIVVDCPSPYNAILGRPTLGGIKAIISTYHLKVKFPTPTGIGKIKGDQKVARQCFIFAMKVETSSNPSTQYQSQNIGDDIGVLRDEVEQLTLADHRKTDNTKPLEEVVPISIHPDYPDRHIMIGTELTDELRSTLINFLEKNSDIFAWSHGYHQIKIYPLDIEKTSFITKRGLYCYKVMPFGLKNAAATYQRLVNRMFKEQIGKTMEVYIDDMLVKSLRSSDHIAHLEETFSILRRHRMMLNPSKCIFGVSSGKFLGFLVTKQGIEVNPDQIQALIAMNSPRNVREVQQLTGRVAALNRFLKEYLGSPPLLTVPTPGEDLYVYLSISPTAVSVVLIREEDQVQKPIYYVSKVLMGAEARYPRIKKLAYALMITARKLRHYFQAHPIIVLTDQPLKPRMAIKAQALADFIVESTHEGTPHPETVHSEKEISEEPTPEKDLAHWTLFVDGSYNQHGCAEYEALLAGLRIVVELGAQSLKIFSDSQLVVNQVQGDYLAQDARMMAYLGEVKAASAKIKDFKIHQIPREDNKKADALANLTSTFESISDRYIPSEFLASPSIGVANQILQTEESPTWMDEIIAYLQGGILPTDKLQARRLQYRSARFCLFKGRLYKRSFSGQLLKCLRPEKAEYVLKEIHEGICGNHSGARSLARKTIRQGYFWPTIERDAATYIRRCDKCQRFAPISRLPHTEMVPISSPWPFAQWGIDILGPLPRAPLQRKFLIVAIDYFTKWIEAQLLAKITEKNTQDFVWKHLVCRFGIPKVIISDNARQFDNDKFKNLKARLERSKSEWAVDLPSILWAYHTTSRRIPTGETPYSMVFGTESVIPVEIGMPSFRTSNFDNKSNEAELRLNLDLLEERKEKAELRQATYKCQVAKYYNQRVKHRSFLLGDLVLRKVTLSTKEPNTGKLGPTWEGPYKVIKVSRPGTYWLEDPNEKALLHSWNAEHLKKYYQ